MPSRAGLTRRRRDMDASTPWKGRGAGLNPANRFEAIHLEREADWDPAEDPAPRTLFFRDATASLIVRNDSPDVGFSAGINPYRGCEHGCVYCYARPSHEYLGFSAGLDFESRIMVKLDAAPILRRELSAASWKPETIALSGNTDCYQPAERRFRLTRACLEVLAEFRNPVGIITKNHMVTRDAGLLGGMAAWGGVAVFVTVTTLDSELAARLEPRASLPALRLEAIRELSAAGIPAGVMVAPIIPGLTDEEIPAILAAAAGAGASYSSKVVLRLPHGLPGLFEEWLERHYPLRAEKVLNRVRAVRGGALNDARFGERMRGSGLFAEQIARLFDVSRRKHGLDRPPPELSTSHFRRATPGQLELF